MRTLYFSVQGHVIVLIIQIHWCCFIQTSLICLVTAGTTPIYCRSKDSFFPEREAWQEDSRSSLGLNSTDADSNASRGWDGGDGSTNALEGASSSSASDLQGSTVGGRHSDSTDVFSGAAFPNEEEQWSFPACEPFSPVVGAGVSKLVRGELVQEKLAQEKLVQGKLVRGEPVQGELAQEKLVRGEPVQEKLVPVETPRALELGECSRTLTSVAALIEQQAPDTKRREFHCQYCDGVLRSLGALERHIAEHTPERLFQCQECNVRFFLVDSLNKHIKGHMKVHSTKWHTCEVCGKNFSNSFLLKSHQRIHTGEMPFLCQLCGGKFRYPASLSYHIAKSH
ncbi:zinc finger protein 184-like [Thrips palmi]|uniref:Zinc finger protein 184-like n=1 Tax=Thrips palmi TaxID=161013 RepID=A0A6P8ZP53_THRPL|nr:zinc finger protein 184-like [Thrips palmi]